MTRLAAGGRAQQPGLLCACWFRSRARANRKARIQAAAMKVDMERTLQRAETLCAAPGSVTGTMTHGNAQKRSQRRHGNAGTTT